VPTSKEPETLELQTAIGSSRHVDAETADGARTRTNDEGDGLLLRLAHGCRVSRGVRAEFVFSWMNCCGSCAAAATIRRS